LQSACDQLLHVPGIVSCMKSARYRKIELREKRVYIRSVNVCSMEYWGWVSSRERLGLARCLVRIRAKMGIPGGLRTYGGFCLRGGGLQTPRGVWAAGVWSAGIESTDAMVRRWADRGTAAQSGNVLKVWLKTRITVPTPTAFCGPGGALVRHALPGRRTYVSSPRKG
jgi:hypothetical protein